MGIRDLFPTPWPAQRNLQALRDRCLQALSAPNPKQEIFGNPDKFPEIICEVLFSGEAMSVPNSPVEWKPLVDFVLKTQRPELMWAMAENDPVTDEFLPNDFFEKHLFDDNPTTQAICARTLSRRGCWDRLTELGWKLSPSGQIFALKELAYPKASRGTYLDSGRRDLTPAEKSFWQHCLNTQPIQAAAALYSARSGGNELLDGMLHQPLRGALLAEVKKSRQRKDDFLLDDPYQMRLAVLYLGDCHQKEDNQVLQALLDDRGYAKEEGSKSDGGPMKPYVAHKFIAREAAREELTKRQIPVREDLVLQEDTTPLQP
ncbi:hypothetical protein BH09VER1_BH09VER1_07830 [soil metagenome]